MKHNPRKSEGIALIEIIISMAVMGVLLIGAHSMMTISMRNNKDGEIEQRAAMYGQQIFEDFKSLPLTISADGKNLGLTGEYIYSLSGAKGAEYKTTAPIVLGNGYQAEVSFKANSSNIGTVLNKQTDIQESYDCNVGLTKDGQNINIIDEDKISNNEVNITTTYDENTPLKLIVNATTADKKDIIIKDGAGNKLLERTFDIDPIKTKPIALNINFSKYKIVESSTLDTNVEIIVYNQDEENINIVCEDKPQNLFVSFEQYGKGQFTLYDENISKNLYDITVKITRDGKTIFNGSASQNIKIIK